MWVTSTCDVLIASAAAAWGVGGDRRDVDTLRQLFPVPAAGVGVSEGVGDGAEERRKDGVSGICQTVVDPKPFLPGGDEAAPSEVGQVARDGGLGETETAVNVADADLSRPQQADDPQPGRVGERLERGF